MKTDIIKNILTLLEKDLDQPLNLDEIAEKMNYSKFYLNRKFQEEMGCTIAKYRKQKRMEKAAQLLVETPLSIADISQEVCYGTQQAFTLAFKQYFHCTPQIYRIKGQSAHALHAVVLSLMKGAAA